MQGKGVEVSPNFLGPSGAPGIKELRALIFSGPDLFILISYLHQIMIFTNMTIWALDLNIFRALTKFWGYLVREPALFRPLAGHMSKTDTVVNTAHLCQRYHILATIKMHNRTWAKDTKNDTYSIAIPQCWPARTLAGFRTPIPTRATAGATVTGPIFLKMNPTSPNKPTTTCNTGATMIAPWICEKKMGLLYISILSNHDKEITRIFRALLKQT